MKTRLIITILIVAIIVIAYVVFVSDTPPPTNSSNTTQQNVNGNSESSESFATTIEKDGDNTYRNTTYGFEITLPESFTMSEFSHASGLEFFDSRSLEQQSDLELTQGMKVEVSVSKDADQSLAEQIDENTVGLGDLLLSRRNVTVDGNPGTQIEVYLLGYVITTYVDILDTRIAISGIIPEPDRRESYLDTYHSIVDSFSSL